MSTFRADTIYFDESIKGISTGISFDNTSNFDTQSTNIIIGEVTVSLSQQKYYARESLELLISLDFKLTENYSKYVDLMELIPLKFHNSVLLQELMDECGLLVGTWIGKINDISKLIDKYNVSEDYIQYLTDLVGFKIIDFENATEEDKRRQLNQVVDWYKEKGVYVTLKHIAYTLGLNLNIWDTYTNDYLTFINQEWFIGEEGENPVGLNSSYYKSPHLRAEIPLNTVYGNASDAYLFIGTTYTNLKEYTELVRPVNVVVHYSIFLNPITTESGDVYIGDGDVKACICGGWEFSRIYFDEGLDSSGNSLRSFDNSIYFDYSKDSFLNGVSVWKFGIGNINQDPNPLDINLESPVITGNIDSHIVYDDRIEFEFTIPSTTVYTGLTELGLYLTGGTTLIAEATFPSIEKVNGVELRVVFTIYK